MRALTEVSVAERFEKLEGTHLGTCAQTFELRLQAIFGYYGLHRLLRGIDTVHLCITCHKASGSVSNSKRIHFRVVYLPNVDGVLLCLWIVKSFQLVTKNGILTGNV
jgi:hypothetical protein